MQDGGSKERHALTDKDLQQELTERKAFASRLRKFIQKKANTTNVILLKTKNEGCASPSNNVFDYRLKTRLL